MIQRESPFAPQTWFRGSAGAQNTTAYRCSYTVRFETHIAPFLGIFERFEVVALDIGQRELGSGRGEHLDLTSRTRKIRRSVTDPK